MGASASQPVCFCLENLAADPPQFHCKRNPNLDILGKEGREETGLVILRNLIKVTFQGSSMENKQQE